MKANYKKIGDYIQELKNRNSDEKAEKLLGININKYFMPSVANVIGTDLSVYKLVQKNQFACNRMHVGRDYRLPISMSITDEEFMVSPAYDVFEIKNTDVLYPEYLMMWFSRKEFDRNAWFYTDADVRGGLSWSSFCEMQLPIPTIEKQREIVAEYNTVQNRINLNNQLIQKLEETAQAIYKSWFVDFEFPSPLNSPPLEGCPQDGVVNSPPLEGCPQDGVVNMPTQPNPQDGLVFPPQPNPQDPLKLKRNAINYFSLPYNPALRQRARDLRKAGNLAEVLFWKQVRNKSFKGLDFDRQKIIGNYIVDFYCPNCQIVVEIDGASHNDKQDYDARRNEYLKSIGLTVIHFTDYEVKENIDSVMQFLDVHPAMNLDGAGKTDQQVTQGVNAAGSFDHPVLRTPLQRRGMPQSGYKSSGGKMVWNEELQKEIPEGWEVKPFTDIVKLGGGGTPDTNNEKYWNGAIPFFTPADVVDSYYSLSTEKNVSVLGIKNSSTKLYPMNTVFVTARGTVGAISIAGCEMTMNQSCYAITGRNEMNQYFTHQITLSAIDKLKNEAVGAVFAALVTKDFDSQILLEPDKYTIKLFGDKIKPVYDYILTVTKENQKLSELKDLLLSKLATIEN